MSGSSFCFRSLGRSPKLLKIYMGIIGLLKLSQICLIKNASAFLVILIPWWLSSTVSKAADKEETKYTCEEFMTA